MNELCAWVAIPKDLYKAQEALKQYEREIEQHERDIADLETLANGARRRIEEASMGDIGVEK